MIQHIRGSCGVISNIEPPTVLYEDLKFFFMRDLQKIGDISLQQVHSCENLADLFTKSLPNSTGMIGWQSATPLPIGSIDNTIEADQLGLFSIGLNVDGLVNFITIRLKQEYLLTELSEES
ncbi:hypothetical protein OSB04_031332 [Centaurea solstitialis]|uniref:Uncharacterized protein n=1 Tax=Centaurea solstitialis TaxID=347529 RepID=A0AA38SAJ2_9ASTR|nr:hypothetical protein OSB04_031332 [Centaurea solstitialis]